MQTCVHPQDLPGLGEAVAAALGSGQALKTEYRVVPPTADPRDRRVRWVAAEGLIIRDDNNRPVRVHGVSRDITVSKQSEAALKESEGRLLDALAAGRVMAFEWDATTRRSQRSDNATEILGDEPHSVVPGRGFIKHLHPDDRAHFKAHVYGVTPAHPSYVVSFRYRRPDGREVWLEEMARAEFDVMDRLLCLKGLT